MEKSLEMSGLDIYIGKRHLQNVFVIALNGKLSQ